MFKYHEKVLFIHVKKPTKIFKMCIYILYFLQKSHSQNIYMYFVGKVFKNEPRHEKTEL